MRWLHCKQTASLITHHVNKGCRWSSAPGNHEIRFCTRVWDFLRNTCKFIKCNCFSPITSVISVVYGLKPSSVCLQISVILACYVTPYVSPCYSKTCLHCHFTYFLFIFLSLVQCLRSQKIPVIAPFSLRSYPQSRMLSSATMDATWWPETTCLSRFGIWTWRAGQWRPIRWDWQMHSSNVWCWLCCATVNGLWGIIVGTGLQRTCYTSGK